ncbi:MAG: lytic murein transglycosylase [Candidatus Magasanikbacteria bacterium]
MKKILIQMVRSFVFVFVILLNCVSCYGARFTSAYFNELVDILERKGFEKVEYFNSSKVSHEDLTFYPEVINIFQPTEKPQDYNPYEDFLSEAYVRAGKKFMRKHSELLQRAEKKYGVPKEYLVTFLGVESSFGRNTGSYQAIGVFCSLILLSDSPEVVNWAMGELGALIKIARIKKSKGVDFNVFDLRSSWAGAFGMSQFLPTSFLYWGVDANDDGVVNLSNLEDSVFSIANYLRANGWKQDPRKAVYHYNPFGPFVDFVFSYARLLHQYFWALNKTKVAPAGSSRGF